MSRIDHALVVVVVASCCAQSGCEWLFEYHRPDASPPRPEASPGPDLQQAQCTTGTAPSQKFIDGATWNLVWAEEFAGPLDTRRWTAVNDGPDKGELQYYRPAEVAIEQGCLRLGARAASYQPDAGAVYQYTAGGLSTLGKWWTQFGRIEVGVRAAAGGGVKSQLQLRSARLWHGTGFDLFEVRGAEPTRLLTTYRWADAGTLRSSQQTVPDGADLTQAFHEVVAQWEPGRTKEEAGKVDWFLDGTMIRSESTPMLDSHPMYLRFQTIVVDALTSPQHLEVDYVRVYQRSDLPGPASNGLLNGSFEDTGPSMNAWHLPWHMKNRRDDGSSGPAVWSADPVNPADGQTSFKATIQATSQTWEAQLSYVPLLFKKDKDDGPYRMTFQARAVPVRDLKVTFQRAYSPWKELCVYYYHLTEAWQKFEFECPGLGHAPWLDDEWPAAVRFDLGTRNAGQLGSVWLDAISMSLPP